MFEKITRKKLLLWVGIPLGALFVISASLAIYIGSRSDDWWRDMVTTTLSQSLEREVEIKGDFSLHLGRYTTLQAASIRVANPEWSESRDMLHLGSLLLEIDLLSVLGDSLQVHRLELAEVELALEENQEGENNWTFVNESEPAIAKKAEKNKALPIQVQQLKLKHVQFSLKQPRWQRPFELNVNALNAGRSPDDEAVIDSHGQLGELPFSLKGHFGKINSAVNSGPVSYKLEGSLGNTKLHSEGSIDSLTAPSRPLLAVSLKGPDIEKITQAMGAPTIAKGPFEARVDVKPGGRGVNGHMQGKFGMLQVNADISTEDLASAQNMDITSHLSGENLAAFSDLLGLPPLPKGSFALDAVLHRDDHITRIETMKARVGNHQASLDGVLGAWPELKDTRLKLAAKGPNLAVFSPTVATIGLGQLPSGAYSVTTQVESDENGLRVYPSKINIARYQATGKGHINTRDVKERFRTELSVTASGPDLSMITRLADTIQLPAWPFQAKGNIRISAKDITLIGTSGTSGEHKVAADGPIAFSPQGPVQLEVKGSGPSLQAVLQELGYDLIPAAAAYQVEGKVEFAKNQIVVKTPSARLGPAKVAGSFTIPDLNTPTSMIIDVHDLTTNDVTAALALVGVKWNLPQVLPANFTGQVKHSKDATELSKIQGSIGKANIKVDGAIGKAPNYDHTRLNLDMRGPNLARFLTHPIEKALPFQIKGKMSLDKGSTHFQDFQLKVANIDAKIHGRLGNWDNLAGSELEFSANGPNLDVLAAVLNRPLPEGAVRIDGHIQGSENAFHVDRMNAEIGRSNLNGELKLVQDDPPLLQGQISSTYLDVGLFRKEVGAEKSSNKKADDISTQGIARKKDKREGTSRQTKLLLFPHTALDLSSLDKINLDLNLRIDELDNLWQRGSLHNLSGQIQLKGRNLSVSDFEIQTKLGGKVKGKFSIAHDSDVAQLDVDMRGDKLRIGLTAAAGQTPNSFPPTDIEAKLSASGNTYRQLAASLDGRLKMVQGEGQVSNSRVVGLLSDTFYQLFQTLNPFAKTEPTTRLDCAVYIVNMANGSAEIPAVVIQTDKLTIVSGGKIDLKTERIDLAFSTRPRRGVGISASAITNSYIKLGGSLAKPVIELDAERATVATGAAVATGGLSFLFRGVWDRFLTSRDPCGEALQKDAEVQSLKTTSP